MLQTDQGQVTIFSLVAIAGATGNISRKNLSVTNCPENWVLHVLFENAEENSCLVNTCERLVNRLAVRLFLDLCLYALRGSSVSQFALHVNQNRVTIIRKS